LSVFSDGRSPESEDNEPTETKAQKARLSERKENTRSRQQLRH
jgi:hypothetical protein